MRAIERLARQLDDLPIPTPSSCDELATKEGVARYREAWKRLEDVTDALVLDIVRANARDEFAQSAGLATKVMKHLEQWRLHAEATSALWDRTWAWKEENCNVDIMDRFFQWIGVKGTKIQWLAKEMKKISRATDRLSSVHSKLHRERELLLEELGSAP